jgi:hypothetical protein
MITSCLECRRRKLKCNKSHPCTNCVKFSRDCVFLAPALDQASQLKLTEIKEKVGSLERLLERDVAKSTSTSLVSGLGRALGEEAEDDLPANEDEKDLEPTPLAVVDAAYGEDGDDDGKGNGGHTPFQTLLTCTTFNPRIPRKGVASLGSRLLRSSCF